MFPTDRLLKLSLSCSTPICHFLSFFHLLFFQICVFSFLALATLNSDPVLPKLRRWWNLSLSEQPHSDFDKSEQFWERCRHNGIVNANHDSLGPVTKLWRICACFRLEGYDNGTFGIHKNWRLHWCLRVLMCESCFLLLNSAWAPLHSLKNEKCFWLSLSLS